MDGRCGRCRARDEQDLRLDHVQDAGTRGDADGDLQGERLHGEVQRQQGRGHDGERVVHLRCREGADGECVHAHGLHVPGLGDVRRR